MMSSPSANLPAGVTRSRLNRHFTAYAAIITGAAVFGPVNKSDAAIVYSGPENLSAGTSQFYINLETGITGAHTGWDVEFSYLNETTGGASSVRIPGTGAVTSVNENASKLDAGVIVSPSVGSFTSFTLADGYYGTGQWLGGVTNKFLGVAFIASDGLLHDAWVRLNVNASTDVVTVVDWAYESTPNTPIVTGATASAVPEPSSAAALGTLALGAVGVRSRRRKAL